MFLLEFVNQLLCLREITRQCESECGTRENVAISIDLQRRLGQRRRFREIAQPGRSQSLVRGVTGYDLFRFSTSGKFGRTF